jgi:hypothetical protein
MACAVVWLPPVSMMMRTPSARGGGTRRFRGNQAGVRAQNPYAKKALRAALADSTEDTIAKLGFSRNRLVLALVCITLGALLGSGRVSAQPREASATRAEAQRPRLQLRIDSPEPGAVVGDPGGMSFIAGRALATHGDFRTFDLIFVIDQSQSTAVPSGGDVNGDGKIETHLCPGVPAILGLLGSLVGVCSTSKDSVLAAELLAVRTLLKQLDPRTTQVGVVAFSGDGDPYTDDAYVSCALTAEYAKVGQALDEIAAMGPQGRTNMQDAVQLAALELIGSPGAHSKPQRDSQKVMLFLSDGTPTLPIEQGLKQNGRLAIEAAVEAAQFGVRIDSYGIGAEALAQPVVLVEMARVTDGIFTPVSRPRDLQSIFEQVSFSEIDELRITNQTNQAEAQYVLRNADGTFSALLEMVPGENTLEVFARATDGSEQSRSVRVQFLSDAQFEPLSPQLLDQRNRLMENRLSDLRQRRLSAETARDEAVRRQLQLRIAEERKKAEARARELAIQPEQEPESRQRGSSRAHE